MKPINILIAIPYSKKQFTLVFFCRRHFGYVIYVEKRLCNNTPIQCKQSNKRQRIHFFRLVKKKTERLNQPIMIEKRTNEGEVFIKKKTFERNECINATN